MPVLRSSDLPRAALPKNFDNVLSYQPLIQLCVGKSGQPQVVLLGQKRQIVD
jgi:hypothetical protein